MKMADEHDYELSLSVKLEKCAIEEKYFFVMHL